MAVLLGVLVAASFGSGDFLGGQASRRAPTLTVLLVAQGTAVTGAVIVAFAVGARVTPHDIAFGAVAGCVNIVGIGLLYQGLAVGPMGVVAPLTAVAASVLAYFDRENAGQCGSCFNGTAAMAAVAGALRDGVATDEDLARLRRWSVVLRGRGACATLDAATNIGASLLDQFPDQVQHHLDNACQTCQLGAFQADRPYQVEAVTPA